jgi:hypothetical protein
MVKHVTVEKGKGQMKVLNVGVHVLISESNTLRNHMTDTGWIIHGTNYI